MVREYNILHRFTQRERFVRSNIRHNLKILRSLICQKDAKFQKVWEKHSNQPIQYEGGRIYMDNHRTCLTLCGNNRVPHKLYSLPPCSRSEKIEDCLLCECSPETLLWKDKGYKGSFITLTADNWLRRYDSRNGTLLQQIYISPTTKFKHLGWDDFHTINIRSIHNKSSTVQRQAGLISKVFMTIAVFTVFPLDFVGMVEITKDIFGGDITDALLSSGVLLIMHTGGLIKFYSWQHILDMGKQFDAPLSGRTAHGTTGQYPDGLPINIVLKERPPVIFEVRCDQHRLVLGGIPWHYIISPPGYSDWFHVHHVNTQQIAENGRLDFQANNIEQDKCLFHADDSGRILHIGANEIRILRIKGIEDCDSRYKIIREFSVRADQLRQQDDSHNQVNEVMITSSGRLVKQKIPYAEDASDCTYESFQSVDYENELDLLSVTAVHPVEDGFSGTVYLLDNGTGDVLKEIHLPEPWREFYDHTIAVDLDMIVHIVKGPMRRFSCYVHRLDRREHITKKDYRNLRRNHANAAVNMLNRSGRATRSSTSNT